MGYLVYPSGFDPRHGTALVHTFTPLLLPLQPRQDENTTIW